MRMRCEFTCLLTFSWSKKKLTHGSITSFRMKDYTASRLQLAEEKKSGNKDAIAALEEHIDFLNGQKLFYRDMQKDMFYEHDVMANQFDALTNKIQQQELTGASKVKKRSVSGNKRSSPNNQSSDEDSNVDLENTSLDGFEPTDDAIKRASEDYAEDD